MTFANPLPVWAIAGLAAAAAAVAWFAYRDVPIAPARRAALSALRFVTLMWIAVCLMRPMVRSADGNPHDALVAVMVDGSRSMGLADVDGARRIDRARQLVSGELLPALSSRFRAELLRFGDRLSPVDAASLTATDRRTELGAALQAVRDRYRGRPVAGIVLITDGGDNGSVDAAAAAAAGPPVYAIGLGPRAAARDREIVSVTAADSVLSDAMVDIAVSAVSHGFGAAPLELRLLENGRAIDHRRVTPAADGAPVSEVFRVAPDRDVPTVYTVEIPAAADEPVAENNARSTLVPAAGRPRRVLLVQGAPGFEHSFLRRAWAADRGLEIDSVVRKGRDDSGAETFYVQAAQSRAGALLGGYPNTRDALFAYDAIVLANVDPDLLTSGQLALTRAFVAERGGGVLVLGARAFQRQGLRDTPLEDVLPLDSTDRGGPGGGVVQSAASPGRNRVLLTAAGESHPVMQLGTGAESNEKRWAAVPPLASISPLGTAKPGAQVLAVTGGPGGAPRALVAVQRFGVGRSMVFTGEASWRWRMLLPTSDQSYERFWRQAVRWLVQSAPDPVSLTLPAAPAPGEGIPIVVDARDGAYAPLADAAVEVRVTSPTGRVDVVQAAPSAGQGARFQALVRAAEPGVYRVAVQARRGQAPLGASAGSMLVGGVDPEMTDPRLNEDTLQRVTRASGGAIVAAANAGDLPARLDAALPAAGAQSRRDLWHTGWSFALLTGLLAAEWLFRRASGLR
ncbi:MAG TPA: glutamine amidotransferase [Vicinamibacterales bacterium]|nr:glutamine amidotransferase [Vicinamibacterales bacterium]